MTANQSFIASMVSFAVWIAGLYGVGILFDRWEARQRAKEKPKP